MKAMGWEQLEQSEQLEYLLCTSCGEFYKKECDCKGGLYRMVEQAREKLIKEGQIIKPKKWQARPISIGMYEVLNVFLEAQVPQDQESLIKQITPDLPWAEEHFQERVCGKPLNPAPSFERWPYYKQDEKWRTDGKFSHTYPERMWVPTNLDGVRYKYGNLKNLIKSLVDDPHTRQAFLPIWFPEDTGAAHGERVPCTIGYWFIHRGDSLHLNYPIRSCDFRRHFRNDIYMACRLLQWVLDELRKFDQYWNKVTPGKLNMQIWNLHVFEGEEKII